jgi:hypothetical protein
LAGFLDAPLKQLAHGHVVVDAGNATFATAGRWRTAGRTAAAGAPAAAGGWFTVRPRRRHTERVVVRAAGEATERLVVVVVATAATATAAAELARIP